MHSDLTEAVGTRWLSGSRSVGTIACCLLALTAAFVGRRQTGFSLEDYPLEEGSAIRWELPMQLREISGLAMTSDHRLLAHNDEIGVIFELDYRDGSIVKEFQLADGGAPIADDFEGIAFAEGRIYLVSSSGRLYECLEGAAGESVLYRVHATGVGRECEIEGLAYDPDGRELLLMCKEAQNPSLAGRLAMYRWSIDDKRVNSESPTVVSDRDYAAHIGANRYRPSGIERHPVSGNYFVVAARPGAIAEIAPTGELMAAKWFTAEWHRQIEGVALATDGALIIADEGGQEGAMLTVYPGPRGRR